MVHIYPLTLTASVVLSQPKWENYSPLVIIHMNFVSHCQTPQKSSKGLFPIDTFLWCVAIVIEESWYSSFNHRANAGSYTTIFYIHSNLRFVYISQFANPLNACLGLWEEVRVPMLTLHKKNLLTHTRPQSSPLHHNLPLFLWIYIFGIMFVVDYLHWDVNCCHFTYRARQQGLFTGVELSHLTWELGFNTRIANLTGCQYKAIYRIPRRIDHLNKRQFLCSTGHHEA